MIEHLLPLYLWIGLGFFLGRFFQLKGRPLARALIYFIAPVVVFTGVWQQQLTLTRLSLPFLFFALCAAVGLVFSKITQSHLPKTLRGVWAYASASGNTGYFGFPLVTALYGTDALGVAILISLGFMIFENTLGFYLMARAQFSGRESLRKLFRLPLLYAFALGCFANALQWVPPDFYNGWIYAPARKVYSALGMLIIGLGLAGFRRLDFSAKEFAWAYGFKFLIWPIGVLALLLVDLHFTMWLSSLERQVMFVMSLVPFPANSVAFSMELKSEPHKVAALVLSGTLFAALFIPAVLHLVKV